MLPFGKSAAGGGARGCGRRRREADEPELRFRTRHSWPAPLVGRGRSVPRPRMWWLVWAGEVEPVAERRNAWRDRRTLEQLAGVCVEFECASESDVLVHAGGGFHEGGRVQAHGRCAERARSLDGGLGE